MLFMSAKMLKIRITTSKSYYNMVLSALHDMGTMQIEQVPDATNLKIGENISFFNISSSAQRFRSLETMLKERQHDTKYTFSSMENLLHLADSVNIDKEVISITKNLQDLDSIKKMLADRLSIISILKPFDGDLSILNSKSIVSFIITNKTTKDHLKQLKINIKQKIKDLIIVDIGNALTISVPRGKESEIASVLNTDLITMTVIPEEYGDAESVITRIENKMNENDQRSIELTERLNEISDNYYPIVSALTEQFEIELKKQEVTTKLGQTERVVVIDGWIPLEDIEKTGKLLKKITANNIVMDILKINETPPTKMENPKTSKIFEFFIKFYSLPKSTEIDPTLVFAIVFPIFFGFMVGDAGYGVVMLIFSLWLSHRIKHPPRISRIPKKIASFVNTIVSNNGLFFISRAVIPGSILAIVFGIIFNNYFGFKLPYTPIFNVEAGIGKLLMISGWIGVIMVSFGFILGFINNMRLGNKKHAIAKIGWLLTAWGIVLLGLMVLHKQPIGLSSPLSLLYISVMVSGIIIFSIGEGTQSLMELPSIVSHILSYTRLVGILLASVILAEVIDLIFLKGLHHSIILAIVGIFILVVGQLFNFVIAVFEPGIQGARLIYVEFFSKFFTGNGKQFTAFKNDRKHTLSTFKLE